MANNQSVFKWQFYLGFILIVTGGLFLVDQLLNLDIMGFFWPLLVVLVGLIFFIAMLVTGRRVSGLAVPGAIITILGVLLFFQNTFNLWITWTYAWGLLISATGLGLLIMNLYHKRLGLRRAAGIIIAIGLVLFIVFGFLFEIILDLSGTNIYSGIFLGSGLVLLGLFVIFSRSLFSRSGKKVPEEVQESPLTIDTTEVKEEAVQASQAAEVSQPAVELGEFTGLHFKSFGEVHLEQADKCDVRIEGQESILEKIKTEVRDSTLFIIFEMEDIDWTDPQLRESEHDVRYFITLQTLEQLDFAGAGTLQAEGLVGEGLELAHTGAGELIVEGLQYQSLQVHFGGLGKIQLEGQVQSQKVILSGMGEYRAENLHSQTAEVDLSGAGSAKVWVEDDLKAIVSGAGKIQYKGSPNLTEENTGIGSIKPL